MLFINFDPFLICYNIQTPLTKNYWVSFCDLVRVGVVPLSKKPVWGQILQNLTKDVVRLPIMWPGQCSFPFFTHMYMQNIFLQNQDAKLIEWAPTICFDIIRTLKERAYSQLLCKVIWPIFNPPKIIARYKCIFQKNVFTSNKKKPNKIMGCLVTLASSKTLWKSTIAFFGTFRRKS